MAMRLVDHVAGDRFIETSMEDLFDGPPAWFSLLISDLLLCVGDDDLVAVFPQMDPERGRVRVLVLTTSRVIDASTGTQPGADRRTRVVPRSGVRDVAVTSYAGVFSHGRHQWPGAFTVTITVDGLSDPVTLPLSTNPSYTAPRVDMRAVLAGLLTDLSRH